MGGGGSFLGGKRVISLLRKEGLERRKKGKEMSPIIPSAEGGKSFYV